MGEGTKSPSDCGRTQVSHINNTNNRECLQPVDGMLSKERITTDLFNTAKALIKSHMPKEDVAKVLDILIHSCSGKHDIDFVNNNINEAIKHLNSKDKTLADEVREYVLSTNGIFLSTDVSYTLQLSTRNEKKNLSIILKRLCDEKIIEKHGTKNGTWRIIDNSCDDIDFMTADTNFLDIKWPFDIQDQVNTLPKNICVVAGEPNAGKTAFLLKFTEMNMDKHDIHYFSSEMGAIEMRERLNKFNRPLDSWSFTPKERVSNFGDVIKPNAINIIDFLEVYEDFYRVGGMIKEIFDKLDKGIAIIAMQKNKGVEYGLGGMRGLEKARLYLTMQPNKIKIVKAKNWKTFENPNNLAMEFKLIQGCEFKEQGFWTYEEHQEKKY